MRGQITAHSDSLSSSPNNLPHIATIMLNAVVVAALAGQAAAFPWVAHSVGMSKRDFEGETLTRGIEARDDQQTCGFNPNHVPAQGITAKYPYCGAKYPAPGLQVCVNNLVPAKVSPLQPLIFLPHC